MFVGRLPELDPFVGSDSGSHTSPSSLRDYLVWVGNVDDSVESVQFF